MTENSQISMMDELLETPSTRGHFLKGAAVAAATLGIAPSVAAAASLDPKHLLKSGAAMTESTKDILNIAATAEAAAVTALYHLHVAVNQGKLNVSGVHVPTGTLVSIVRAALREEQDHYAFVTGAGGRPLYTSFTVPMNIFTSATDALKLFLQLETVFVGAYMAATREFANGGMGKLAQYTYQIGGVEAEHRTLMRAGLGYLPPNNKSYESNLFMNVAGAAKVLGGLGVFKPGVPYPGAMAVQTILATTATKNRAAGVVQRTP